MYLLLSSLTSSLSLSKRLNGTDDDDDDLIKTTRRWWWFFKIGANYLLIREFWKTASIVSSSSSLYIDDISQSSGPSLVDSCWIGDVCSRHCYAPSVLFSGYICVQPIGWRDQNWRKPVGRDQRRWYSSGKQSFPFLSTTTTTRNSAVPFFLFLL